MCGCCTGKERAEGEDATRLPLVMMNSISTLRLMDEPTPLLSDDGCMQIGNPSFFVLIHCM